MKFTRSASVDIFLKQQKQKQYNRHLQKINEIKQHREENRKQAKSIMKITEKIHKAHEQARNFKLREDLHHRSLQNKKMERYIANIQPMIRVESKNQGNPGSSVKVQHITRNSPIPFVISNTSNLGSGNYPTIKDYLVAIDNKKLADGIRAQQVNIKNYKKKLATQVSEYIKLREHIQRFKTIKEDGCISSRKTTKVMKTQRIQRTERSDQKLEHMKVPNSVTKNLGKKDRQKFQSLQIKCLKTQIKSGAKIKKIRKEKNTEFLETKPQKNEKQQTENKKIYEQIEQTMECPSFYEKKIIKNEQKMLFSQEK